MQDPDNHEPFVHSFAETKEIQEVVCRVSGSSYHSDLGNNASCMFDVLVCGGTLGIFIATALVSKGLRVGIVERNLIKGVFSYALWRFFS